MPKWTKMDKKNAKMDNGLLKWTRQGPKIDNSGQEMDENLLK